MMLKRSQLCTRTCNKQKKNVFKLQKTTRRNKKEKSPPSRLTAHTWASPNNDEQCVCDAYSIARPLPHR
jgi:hypothetical protein